MNETFTVGPWSPHASVLAKELVKIIKPGDILCRLGRAVYKVSFNYTYLRSKFGFKSETLDNILGRYPFLYENAKICLELPFSSTIAYLTESLYSHAALVVEINEKYSTAMIADVTNVGLRIQTLEEWLLDVYSPTIHILAPKTDEEHINKACDYAIELFKKGTKYNRTFSENVERDGLYCVQLVYEVYNKFKPNFLNKSLKIKEFPRWGPEYEVIARLFGINTELPARFVGNSRIGLMSEDNLELRKIVSLPAIHQRIAKDLNIETGYEISK
jgi:hypothetical protein